MIRETDIALQVAETIRSDGWDPHYEVTLPREIREDHPLIGDGRADIVAPRGNQLLVVECKRDLSFDLFAQAFRWRRYANAIAIGVPYAKPSDGRREAFRIARGFYGFGVFEVGDDGVKILSIPRLREREDDALLHSLREEQKTYCGAGLKGGEHFSAFHGTATGLAQYVASHQGCTLEEAITNLPTAHHYYRSHASALHELTKQIKRGALKGVHFGWRQRLWSTEEQAKRGSAA